MGQVYSPYAPGVLPSGRTRTASLQNKTEVFEEVEVDDVVQTECREAYADAKLSITVLGASGDLAKKKTYPALLDLFHNNFLPPHVNIVGFARTGKSAEEFREYLRPWLLKFKGQSAVDKFLARCWYFKGERPEDFAGLNKRLLELEGATSPARPGVTNRFFYLAVPPDAFISSARCIRRAALSPKGFNRLIVEKPFGRDLASAKKLAADLKVIFSEDHIYRIDHYLGKEMVQNLSVFRFANGMLGPLFNRDHVQCVRITCKEDFGTEGRGGYFTNYGIIRDIIQNHLMQVLAVLAMEQPKAPTGNSVRDAKVAVIKAIAPIKSSNVVVGQYVGSDGKPGYLEDASIVDKARAELVPTFVALVVYVKTARWAGVPFLIKAGKALNERKAEIRIQFKDAVGAEALFGAGEKLARNELVMQLQPVETIYVKTIVKTPGLEAAPQQAELDLSYKSRFKGAYNPDAYTRLMLEALRGNQAHFVRSDEITASWQLFDPLLQELEDGQRPPSCCRPRCCSSRGAPRMPLPYAYGSRGPVEAEQLFEKHGFRRAEGYTWPGQ